MTSAENPVVDVCVLTWNTRDATVAALQRLVTSDQGITYRILVRDNGSHDGTVEAINAALPTVPVEAGEENLGYAAGMNRLLRRGHAPYVLLLNSDAWLEDGALRRLVDAARAHPDAGLVVPRVLRPDGTLEHSTWPWPTLRLSLLCLLGLHRALPRSVASRLQYPPAWRHDRSRYVSWAVGAAWLLPRAALDAVGPLDERFFMYGEDIDWCLRARRHGLRVWFQADAVVRHVGNASADLRYRHEVPAMKAAASDRVMRMHRGPVAAAAYRWIDALFYLRVGAVARMRGDDATAAYCRSVVRGHRRRPTDAAA